MHSPEYWGTGIRVRVRVRDSVGVQVTEYWGAGISVRFSARVQVRVRDSIGVHIPKYLVAGLVFVLGLHLQTVIILGCKYPSIGVLST